VVECQPERLSVEVAAGHDLATGDHDGRIVDGGRELRLEHATHIGEAVPVGAVHLRNASQRVGVLDEVLGVAVRCDDRAALEQLPEIGGDRHGAGMLAERYELGVEGAIGTERGLDGHRSGDVRGPGQSLGAIQAQRPDGEHHFGAVDERKALFVRQLERLDARAVERLRGRHNPSIDVDPALSHERERQVSEGSEVSRRPQ